MKKITAILLAALLLMSVCLASAEDGKTQLGILNVNGGGFRSVKTPAESAPTAQAAVYWTFDSWNMAERKKGRRKK